MQENLPEHLPEQSEDWKHTPEGRRRMGRSVEAQDLLETAKFLGHDSDLRVFHRFDKLRLFIILRLQRRLARMTRDLEELVPSKETIHNGTPLDEVEDDKLSKLTENIEHTLRDYGIQA